MRKNLTQKWGTQKKKKMKKKKKKIDNYVTYRAESDRPTSAPDPTLHDLS